MSSKIGLKNINKSVVITMDLLNCLSESRVPLRLNEIAEYIDLPQATVLRYLNTLIVEGYIYREKIAGRYCLTWKINKISEQLLSHLSLRNISSDVIGELSNNLNFGVALVIEHEMECFYLDCLYEPNNIGIALARIGKKTPLHASSSGKTFLSSYSESELDNYIEIKGLEQLTEHTISEKESLKKELEIVNKKGFAMDNEECEEGLRCISMPIYSFTQKPVAAISIFGTKEKLTDKILKESIMDLLETSVKEISYRLGYDNGFKTIDEL